MQSISDSSNQPWSNGPNAPHIPYFLYLQEKGYFAGAVIAAVLYGIAVALFFQCMSALLLPVSPTTKGVRWGLVAYSVALFSFLTIGFATNRNIFSMAYIDEREFTGVIPGPLGFIIFPPLDRRAVGYFSFLTFSFVQWLADGLLLYRCFVIYAMNYWAIAVPFMMYLASVVTGILWSYHNVRHGNSSNVYNMTYMAICFSLNVLLTLIIIIRLALHSRNIRNAIGASSAMSGLYTAIITMLVESSALNAVGYLLFIVPDSLQSFVAIIFSQPLGEIQVIALFLITLRVTNRTALTSDAVASGNLGSIHFSGSTGGPVSSHGETSSRPGVEVETGSQET